MCAPLLKVFSFYPKHFLLDKMWRFKPTREDYTRIRPTKRPRPTEVFDRMSDQEALATLRKARCLDDFLCANIGAIRVFFKQHHQLYPSITDGTFTPYESRLLRIKFRVWQKEFLRSIVHRYLYSGGALSFPNPIDPTQVRRVYMIPSSSSSVDGIRVVDAKGTNYELRYRETIFSSKWKCEPRGSFYSREEWDLEEPLYFRKQFVWVRLKYVALALHRRKGVGLANDLWAHIASFLIGIPISF